MHPYVTAALFTIAKTQKQLQCPSTEDVVHTYDGILLSHKIMPLAATWMQLEILIVSEGRQKEKDKYHMISLISGI